MMREAAHKLTGILLVLGSALLLVGWFAIPLASWKALAGGDFLGMVLGTYWVPINVAILISLMLILVGVVGVYIKQSESSGRWGLTGFVLVQVGIASYACIQYYETFLWPVIAERAPELFGVVGIPLGDPLLRRAFLSTGIPWAMGFAIFGLSTGRSRMFPLWAVVLFSVGALLFGLVPILPVRSLGALLFCAGGIRLGVGVAR